MISWYQIINSEEYANCIAYEEKDVRGSDSGEDFACNYLTEIEMDLCTFTESESSYNVDDDTSVIEDKLLKQANFIEDIKEKLT